MIACEVFVITAESEENKIYYYAENFITDEHDMLLDCVPYWASNVTDMDVCLYDTRKEAIEALKEMLKNIPTAIEIKKNGIATAKVTTIVNSLVYPALDVELPITTYSKITKEE